MKILFYFLLTILMLGSVESDGGGGGSALPPTYLAVPDFKLCLGRKEESGKQSWCFPKEKPNSCSADSWKQLKTSKANGEFEECKDN